jgi:hypothetical protein
LGWQQDPRQIATRQPLHAAPPTEVVRNTSFKSLSTGCRTASCDSFDLFAKEEFRQLATEFAANSQRVRRLVEASRTGQRVAELLGLA